MLEDRRVLLLPGKEPRHDADAVVGLPVGRPEQHGPRIGEEELVHGLHARHEPINGTGICDDRPGLGVQVDRSLPVAPAADDLAAVIKGADESC